MRAGGHHSSSRRELLYAGLVLKDGGGRGCLSMCRKLKKYESSSTLKIDYLEVEVNRVADGNGRISISPNSSPIDGWMVM